ncbi:MAG: hypothetical protein KAU14_10175, partial [Thermoplasmata archaeon]|nr:hypothetical protein [Thermoplasmata archaeon]
TTEKLFLNIFSPGKDEEVSGEITISGNATPLADSVEIRIENQWMEVDQFDNGHDYQGEIRSGNWSHTVDTEEYEDGTFSIQVRCASGTQYSPSKTRDIIINNNVPPEITQFMLDGDEYQNGDSIHITGKIKDENGIDDIDSILLMLWDSGEVQVEAVDLSISEIITTDYELPKLEKGDYSLRLIVEDKSGETAETSKGFLLENAVPEILSFQIDKSKIKEKEKITITAEITDADGMNDIARVVFEIRDSSGKVKNSVELPRTETITYTHKPKVKEGNYLVVIRVEDSSGDSVEQSISLAIEKKDDDDPEIAGINAYILVPVIIGVIALIIGGVIVRTRLKKEEAVPKRKFLCPICKGPAAFIKEKNRWVCHRCKKFIKPLIIIPKPKVRICPVCGEETTLSEEYDDHYCWNCEEYVGEMEE